MFHITEVEDGGVRELHLCEDHARVYLNQAEADSQQEDSDIPSGPLGVNQTAKELSEIDQLFCDMCGITFFEFRNQGRLGCPHDYVQFEKELEPLIANIHGEVQHRGRRPRRRKSFEGEPLPESTEELTSVIGMRRENTHAIAAEEYERGERGGDDMRDSLEKWKAGASRN